MSDHKTRLDPSPPRPTKRDAPLSTGAPTRRDSTTARDGSPVADLLQRALPSRLAARFRTVRELPAAGAEADLLLVESVAEPGYYIAKIYRLGIAPKLDVLNQVAAVAPEHVVRRFDYGECDGRWYELLEYVEEGSLRTLIDTEGPQLSPATAEAVLRELMLALEAVHRVNIVHRDLKPENILVRRRRPLDLVLTDFGISSLVECSLRFSAHGHRTVAYAAPESSANAVSPALDYWSLGIIIAEMLLGKHPLADVSEPVMLRHLATRPVPLDGVPDRWKLLCRGLLTRDDRQRWGNEQVARWLRGDQTLRAAEEAAASDASDLVKPYRFGGQEHTAPETLAIALAADWESARKELGRGYIRRWAYDDLRDLELTRFLDNQDEDRSASIDLKLFRTITRMNPGASPSYFGYSLEQASLRELALKGVRDDERAQDVLATLFDQRFLDAFTRITDQRWAGELEKRWRGLQEQAQVLRAKLVQDRSLSDDALPKRKQQLSGLLLTVLAPDFAKKLTGEIAHAQDVVGKDCPWYTEHLLDQLDGPGLFVLAAAAPVAIQYAQTAREQRAEERRRRRIEIIGSTRPLWAAGIWIAALLLVSAHYDWSPRPRGPLTLLRVTRETPGNVWAKTQCMFNNLILSDVCYEVGSRIEVLDTPSGSLCISAKSGKRECFDRRKLLEYTALETGFLPDYSNTLGIGAKLFWLGGFPILLFGVVSMLFREFFGAQLPAGQWKQLEERQKPLMPLAFLGVLAVALMVTWPTESASNTSMPPANVASGNQRTVTVTASKVNIRSTAARNASVEGQVVKDQTLTVLRQDGDWLEISLAAVGKSGTGWLLQNFVTNVAATPAGTPEGASPATPQAAGEATETADSRRADAGEVRPDASANGALPAAENLATPQEVVHDQAIEPTPPPTPNPAQLGFDNSQLFRKPSTSAPFEESVNPPAPPPPTAPQTSPLEEFQELDCFVPVFHTSFMFPPEGGAIVRVGTDMYFVRTYQPGCANATSVGQVIRRR